MEPDEGAPGVGGAFLAAAAAYALVAALAALQLARNCRRYRPWTVQKLLHALLGAAAALRAGFLALVARDWCGVLQGEVAPARCSAGQRDLFYVLDQAPVLALVAVYALLVQFWAEVYYNAVDQLAVLAGFVKPMIRWTIAAVLIVQTIFWVFYASVWRSEHAFFTRSQAILNTEMFLVITAGFVFFARKAYTELRLVPVELGIRSRKLKELAVMTSVGTSCFITRCALQILLATEKRQLHDRGTWIIVVVYYAVLEILPILSVLYFNRRLPKQRRTGRFAASRSPIIGARLADSKAFERSEMTKGLLAS